MKRLAAIVASFVIGLPFILKAQDDGTYIEDLNIQDSSYMDPDMGMAADSASSGNSTVIIIVAVVIIVAAVVFFLMKKKKK